jgi:hypothetical protein
VGGEVGRQRLELVARARAVGQVDPLRELFERQPAVDGVEAQRADGLLALEIRGANGWSLVAQGSRSLSGTPVVSKTGAERAA